MNGFTLLALIVLAIGVVVAYRAGALRERRTSRAEAPLRPLIVSPASGAPVAPPSPVAGEARSGEAGPAPVPAVPGPPAPRLSTGSDSPAEAHADPLAAEHYRLVLSFEAEAAALRQGLATREAEATNLRELALERRALFGALADARAETARYRQILVDLENNAPPPLLDGPGAPDDLKLIVGVGPVLERMLQQIGITTYRQIARWTDRDIDEFDARLPEFHGRIRRDGWVTQARALHQSKYGEPPWPARG